MSHHCIAMNYGETRHYEAVNGERRVFVLKRSGTANSKGFKLYQYDGQGLNFLEDFALDTHFAPKDLTREVKARIRIYTPDSEIRKITPRTEA